MFDARICISSNVMHSLSLRYSLFTDKALSYNYTDFSFSMFGVVFCSIPMHSSSGTQPLDLSAKVM